MSDQNGKKITRNRMDYYEVIRMSLWVDARQDFKTTHPTVEKVIADYRVASGREAPPSTVRKVFNALGMPLARTVTVRKQRKYKLQEPKPEEAKPEELKPKEAKIRIHDRRRSERTDRLIKEVRVLSDRIDRIITVFDAEDDIDHGITDGLRSLVNRQAKPKDEVDE